MIDFAWPWLLLALPLPLLAWRYLPAAAPAAQAALKVPLLADFELAASEQLQHTPKRNLLWLAVTAWVLLVLAATRPQWLGEPVEQAVSGRDLLLAMDVSGSMDEKDFRLNDEFFNRLTVSKKIASEFIERRSGDRVGLILFGTTAYLHVPLTFDRKTVSQLLGEAFIGITDDEPQTAIGDAIGLAVKRLEREKEDSRVLILLTDGANTAGEVLPLTAADLAAKHHVKIYTIGIGADEMIVRSFFGNHKVNPSADLDEKTLKGIADKTGGRYFRARNTEELEKIYQILDELEPVEKDRQYFRPKTELFYWPLGVALLLNAVLAVLRWRSLRMR